MLATNSAVALFLCFPPRDVHCMPKRKLRRGLMPLFMRVAGGINDGESGAGYEKWREVVA